MEDNKNDTIDFAAEVGKLFNDFPYLRRHAIYINTEDCSESLRYYKAREMTKEYIFDHATADDLRAKVKEIAAGRQSSMCHVILELASIGPFVVQERHKFSAILLNLSKQSIFQRLFNNICAPLQSQLFSMNHETGHALCDLARGTENIHERVADSFAALQHLRRFDGDVSLLAQQSWQRAYWAFIGKDTQHFTSPTLDHIIDIQEQRPAGMIPKEQLPKEADRLGRLPCSTEKINMTTEDITSAMSNLRTYAGWSMGSFDRRAKQMAMISSSALAASNKFAFYVGAKIFQPFLCPEGVIINGTHIRLKEEKRSELADKFIEKAKAMGFPALAQNFEDNKAGKFHFHPKGQGPKPIVLNAI